MQLTEPSPEERGPRRRLHTHLALQTGPGAHAPDEDSARPGTPEPAVGVRRAHAVSRHVHGAACEQEADGRLRACFTDGGNRGAEREPRGRARRPESHSPARAPSRHREVSSERPVRASLPVSGHTERLHGVGARAPAAGPLGRWVSWPAPWRLGLLLSWIMVGGPALVPPAGVVGMNESVQVSTQTGPEVSASWGQSDLGGVAPRPRALASPLLTSAPLARTSVFVNRGSEERKSGVVSSAGWRVGGQALCPEGWLKRPRAPTLTCGSA